MNHDTYLACTYHDLDPTNLNIPQSIWGNFSTPEDAIDYIKKLRRRKYDTLYHAWDIYHETGEVGSGWHYNKIVKHFSPRKDHDFFGRLIINLKVATIIAC